MLDIYYDEEANTIHSTLTGDIRVCEVKEYIRKISRDFEFHEGIFILENLENAYLNFDYADIENDLSQLLKLIKTLAEEVHFIKVATIVGSTGSRSILQYFVNSSLSTIGYYHKVFTSRNKAVGWLHSYQQKTQTIPAGLISLVHRGRQARGENSRS